MGKLDSGMEDIFGFRQLQEKDIPWTNGSKFSDYPGDPPPKDPQTGTNEAVPVSPADNKTETPGSPYYNYTNK